MNTLYISDLDGTLLNSSAELSDHTEKRLIHMLEKGINFTIATARTPATACEILGGVKLSIPAVLMNGVLVYDIEKKSYLKIHRIPPHTVTTIISLLQSMRMTGLLYELKDNNLRTYYESLESEPICQFINERKVRYHKSFNQAVFSDIASENIIYFMFLDVYDKIKPVHDALIEIPEINLVMYPDNYSEDLWYLEVFEKGASKQNGVIFLRNHCGYENIVGFGDNLNDLSMFAACDMRIAVGNAKQEVKEAADDICGTNDNDGVVKWMEQAMETLPVQLRMPCTK